MALTGSAKSGSSELPTITSDMISSIADGEGLFSFSIYNDSGSVYSPTPTSINTLSAVGLRSVSTTFTFNPLAISLNAGTYKISSQFSGIKVFFDNETALCNSDSTFITFTVDRTIPTMDMSVLLNPTDVSTGVKGTSTISDANNTLSYYYRQLPYLSLKIQSPVSMAAVYNSSNDIPGVTTISYNSTPMMFNDVSGNGTLINSGTIVESGDTTTTTTIVNVANTKVVQFRLQNVATYPLLCSFVPTDTVNYTNTSFTITLTVNPYKPVIISNPQPTVTIPNETTQAANLDPSTIPDTSQSSNQINYDESFLVTNQLTRYDDTIFNYTLNNSVYTSSKVDYSDIDGTITMFYKTTRQTVEENPVSLLSNGDNLPLIGSSISILFNITRHVTIYLRVYNGDITKGLESVFSSYLPESDNIRRIYEKDQVLTINLSSLLNIPNFSQIDIDIEEGNVTWTSHYFRLRNPFINYSGLSNPNFTIYNGVYTPPAEGTLSFPNDFTSVTPSNNYLTWNTLVKPQQIPKDDENGYTLALTFVPTDTNNILNSIPVSIPIYMTIANALGTFTLFASTPPDFNESSANTTQLKVTDNYTTEEGTGVTLSGTITLVSSPEVDTKTGTVSFYYATVQGQPPVKMSATAAIAITGTDLSQKFSVNTTELNARRDPYYITAKFTSTSANYPIITQGNGVFVQVNPLLTLSFSSTSNVTTFSSAYQAPVTISATINTGTEEFVGGEPVFTFTPTDNSLQTFTYMARFAGKSTGGGIITFNTTGVSSIENPSNGLNNDLARGRYTITCNATFPGGQFNVTDQNNTLDLQILAKQVGFTLSIDKPVIFYKEANVSLPIYKATFDAGIVGGSSQDVYLLWTVTGINNTYTYTQYLSNFTFLSTFTFQQPADLPVDSYTITCTITSPNYGTYASVNTIFLVVNKNNDIIIDPASVPVFYTPVTYGSSVVVTATLLLNNGDTVSDGTIQFLLVDSNTVVNGTKTTGQTYSATLNSNGALGAGVYDVGVYFTGNSLYNASPIVTSSIVIKKASVSNASAITTSYATTGTDYKLTLTLPVTVTDSDVIVYTDLQQKPIYSSVNVSSNTIVVSDTFLRKGSNGNDLYAFVSNNNTITSFPMVNFVVPQIAISTISVFPSVSTTTYNSSVTFTATVASAKSGDTVNEGEILFVLNGTSVIKYAAVSNNVASASFEMLDMGAITVTAKFVSSINYADSSTASCDVTVTTRPITLTLTKNNVTTVTKEALLTATLSTASDLTNDVYVNTGYITFTTTDANSNVKTLFDNVPVKNNVASVAFVLAANVSIYNISATFSGNTRYSTATSNSLTITPTLGTIITDYKSLTFTTVDDNTGSGFLIATATVTPVNNTYFYKNSGDVVFSMNNIFVSAPLSNGTASATFVVTTVNQKPTVTYQNLDYYSDMLAIKTSENKTPIDVMTYDLDPNKTYTIYNGANIFYDYGSHIEEFPEIRILLFGNFQKRGDYRINLHSKEVFSFIPNILSNSTDVDYVEVLNGLGASFTLLAPGNVSYSRLSNNKGLDVYEGVYGPETIVKNLAFPTPYGLVSTAGNQSVELSLQSPASYFNISSSPSVSITNPVKATSTSSTNKKITIAGLNAGVSYVFSAVATDSTGTKAYSSSVTFPAAVPTMIYTTTVLGSGALPASANDNGAITSSSSISRSNFNNLYFTCPNAAATEPVQVPTQFTITGLRINGGTVSAFTPTVSCTLGFNNAVTLTIPTLSSSSSIDIVTDNIGTILTLTVSSDGSTVTASNIPDAVAVGKFWFN
jgi:hypothetical protein